MKKAIVRAGLLTFALGSMITFNGCGGGGGASSNNANSNTASLSGVIATGAPVPNAQVTVVDKNGNKKSGTAGTDGKYSIVVSEMTAPFVLEASGIVGGSGVVLHSVAQLAPAANTSEVTNITPLTDSIVANIANGDPSAFFKAPDSSKITQASINLAQASLRSALASMTTAASLPTNIDFITTPFNADKTGMDAVLEAVKVSVSVENNAPVVRIVDKFDQSQVVSLTGSGTPAVNGTINQSTLPDISGMDAIANQFTAAIASPSAMTSLLPALLDPAFLDSGLDKAAAISYLQSNTGIIGAKVGLPVVQFCNAAGDQCAVKVTITYSNGNVSSYSMVLKKQANGAWDLYGNQYHHDFVIEAGAQSFIRTDGVASPAPQTGLHISVDTAKGSVGSAIVSVQGANGPVELVRLSRKSSVCGTSQNYLAIDQTGNCSNFYPMSDADIDQLVSNYGANPSFSIRLFSDEAYTTPIGTEGNGTYSNLYLSALPLKTSELATNLFASLTDSAKANLAAFGPSGPLTLSWTASSSVPVNGVSAILSDYNLFRSLSEDGLIGSSQVTLSGNDQTGAATATSYRSVYLSAMDSAGRNYWTKYYGCGGGTCY